jgi:hypothetical protein
MGSLSAGHYSIILQPIFFAVAAFFTAIHTWAAIGMRLIIIAADIGTFILAVNY